MLWIRTQPFLLFLTMSGVLACTGCGDPTSVSVSQRETSWSSYTNNATPGIDQAAITQVTLRRQSEEAFFVVWSDLPQGASASASSAPSGGNSVYQGTHRSNNGKSIDFHVDSSDGLPTSVVINDTAYQLADGNLFLVSTQSVPAKVSQLRVEPKQMPGSKERLLHFANLRPEIKSFFDPIADSTDAAANVTAPELEPPAAKP